jgi:hypothetical protein
MKEEETTSASGSKRCAFVCVWRILGQDRDDSFRNRNTHRDEKRIRDANARDWEDGSLVGARDYPGEYCFRGATSTTIGLYTASGWPAHVVAVLSLCTGQKNTPSTASQSAVRIQTNIFICL